ncbi:hypothetical protein, partial [Zoogloea sp.]|uniref:hypothetical protein n=1 Tax=Zoogloea sp. TaxID=49181 RepID=UPI00258F9A7F
ARRVDGDPNSLDTEAKSVGAEPVWLGTDAKSFASDVPRFDTEVHRLASDTKSLATDPPSFATEPEDFATNPESDATEAKPPTRPRGSDFSPTTRVEPGAVGLKSDPQGERQSPRQRPRLPQGQTDIDAQTATNPESRAAEAKTPTRPPWVGLQSDNTR